VSRLPSRNPVSSKIKAERVKLTVPPERNKLRNKAAIGIFAKTGGNVEIVLIYSMSCI
jgi:hypothetical protein